MERRKIPRGCGPTRIAAPRDLTANRLRHCPDTIRGVAMKGVAIAPGFTQRQGAIRGKWAASVGAADLNSILTPQRSL